MCLVTFIKDGHPDYPFIFVANRDEAYDRPAVALHRWVDDPAVTAGIDLKEFGTWLGYTDSGRFIAVLNHPFTNWKPTATFPRSRGQLLRDYLTEKVSIAEFEKYLKTNRTKYNGFHLLFGTFEDLRYYSNVENRFQTFKPGVHCLTNTLDDLSNYRRDRSGALLKAYVANHSERLKIEELTALLADKQIAETLEVYPKELDYETALNHSSIFIQGEDFGTVGTTAILVGKDGKIRTREVKYNRTGITETTTKEQQLNI